MKNVTIATRGSSLALWQANYVKAQIEKKSPEITVHFLVIKTKGDRILDVPLAKVGGKGLFVKEIEEALLTGSADIAVHSLKDVPMVLQPELFLGAILEREDPTDVFLSAKYPSLEDLPYKASIGTSSLRRQAQLCSLRNDLEIIPLRGNIDTRLRKLMNNEFDAIVMASSGVKRLGLAAPYMKPFAPDVVLPAVGQGALGIECKEEREDLREIIAFLDHSPTRVCVEAERVFLKNLDGGCQVPIAGYAVMQCQDTMKIEGLVAEPDGSCVIRKQIEGALHNAQDMALMLSNMLIGEGAGDILAKFYNTK